MYKIVPVKNIDKTFVDVKKPGFDYSKINRVFRLNVGRAYQKSAKSKHNRQVFLWSASAFAAIILIFGVYLAFNLANSKNIVLDKSRVIANSLLAGGEALKNLESVKASEYFKLNETALEEINGILKYGNTKNLLAVLGNVFSPVQKMSEFFDAVFLLNKNLLVISNNLANLEKNGFRYFQSDGKTLIDRLNEIKVALSNVSDKGQLIKNLATGLKDVSPFFSTADEKFNGDYLKYSADLYKFNDFLANLISFLGIENGRHLLVLFQNPAEIRPSGGFLGSYADLTIRQGQMINLDVRDIYDPDGQLKRKIVPPWPLQTTTKDLGARDANWFFDFPTSAKTVTNLLESSKMYSEKMVTFDGAIALNINVIQTLLDLTGPIELQNYKLTIDKDNFLAEVQRQTEVSADKNAGQPKKILQVMAPILLERLSSLKNVDPKDLLKALTDHFAKKDIIISMKDPRLAGFFHDQNLDGAVYDLPQNFWGSYLAVVNANVAGGKSDAFIDETIEARLEVDNDGGTLTDLKISRSHTGDKEKESWWRATNKNFLQIFANAGANLISLTGNNVKSLVSNFDYILNSYEKISELDQIEQTKKYLPDSKAWTMKAFGKTDFATWLFTPAGQTSVLTARYQSTESVKKLLMPGDIYQFIFERQSGVKNHLKVTIAAPLGFTWTESGNSFYTYENNDPAGRVIINLTLAK
ncbi:MAG: DUF4012 domain-containing protein [Patescibacteria group bacterium]